jgi:hypothetical protein
VVKPKFSSWDSHKKAQKAQNKSNQPQYCEPPDFTRLMNPISLVELLDPLVFLRLLCLLAASYLPLLG